MLVQLIAAVATSFPEPSKIFNNCCFALCALQFGEMSARGSAQTNYDLSKSRSRFRFRFMGDASSIYHFTFEPSADLGRFAMYYIRLSSNSNDSKLEGRRE
ncbi:hypothetical protein CANARDRAFT_27271 [[Candida] arabinofermentans NRRL YB-2248]|uniref:Uncharacterized protein n=1 Tax=[Candida] arabinofermentans NRRL YB-2248 TaxID=983967 RepID=A0A1E4T572_9ASCO|nr:hypothetical protein CANARDRAFT_27271 [[Candida] arabinofermentans NRRL YB-2248]